MGYSVYTLMLHKKLGLKSQVYFTKMVIKLRFDISEEKARALATKLRGSYHTRKNIFYSISDVLIQSKRLKIDFLKKYPTACRASIAPNLLLKGKDNNRGLAKKPKNR